MLANAAGAYRFTDFMKLGLIINLVIFIITCIFAPLIWPFKDKKNFQKLNTNFWKYIFTYT